MEHEQPLPKIESVNELHNELLLRNLTRHTMVGYSTGIGRDVDGDKKVCHIYRGSYDSLEKGMCPKAYNRRNCGFSIFRNNYGRGICKRCLKNTLHELNK